jgi:excisionase family DNA binding protein
MRIIRNRHHQPKAASMNTPTLGSTSLLPKTLSNNLRLTRRQAAEYLGVTPETLAVWACTGRYELPYFRSGKKVIYKQSDLDEFIRSRTFGVSGEVTSR